MKKFCLLPVIVILFSIMLQPVAALAAAEPEVSAPIAMLVEQTTGTVLYTKNSDQRAAPASITKLMTALLTAEAYENGQFDVYDNITVSENVFKGLEGRSSLGFSEGEQIPVYDVLACCLIASVNEAGNMLAEFVAGDISTFVSMMNERAAELGCTGTHFTNVHGLPDDDHYTTAEDIYRIFTAAQSHTLIAEIMEMATYTVGATNTSDERTITNTNRLLLRDGPYYYEYCVGGKTGTTNAAGNCLASAAEKDGFRLVSIVLGAEAVWSNISSNTIMSFVDSSNLFKWGFENFGYVNVLNAWDDVGEVPVEMGDGADSVVLRPESEVSVYTDLSVQPSEIEKEIKLYSEEALTAPVKAGDRLGTLTVKYNGENIGVVNLVAGTSVSLLHKEYIRNEINKLFGQTWVKLLITAVAVILIAYAVFVIRHGIIRRRKLAEDRIKAEKRMAAAGQQPDAEYITESSGRHTDVTGRR